MATPPSSPRVFVLGNPAKAQIHDAFEEVCAIARRHAVLVGAELSLNTEQVFDARPDVLIVLGGDGTMIGVARSMGRKQIPVIGVNLGKLGYLAEFSVTELAEQFTSVVCGQPPLSERMMLSVTVHRNGETCFDSPSVNDCVVQAGAPFRMIRLHVAISGRHLTDVAGDGLIVCTPSGSTGHNLSAGGPVVQAGVKGIVVTPLGAHSLSHRPIVVEHQSRVEVRAQQVNAGTTLLVDGQVTCPLRQEDRIAIRRYAANFLVVHNTKYPKWHNLVTKLGWGQPIA